MPTAAAWIRSRVRCSIALAGVVALLAVWLVALRPKPVSIDRTPLAPLQAIPKAKQAAAASDGAARKLQAATGGSGQASAPAAPAVAPATAAARAPATSAKPAAASARRLDGAVLRDMRAGKVVVVLFWNAAGRRRHRHPRRPARPGPPPRQGRRPRRPDRPGRSLPGDHRGRHDRPVADDARHRARAPGARHRRSQRGQGALAGRRRRARRPLTSAKSGLGRCHTPGTPTASSLRGSPLRRRMRLT